jgi:hypothetical protein
MRPRKQAEPETARILEIGDWSFMKAAFPNQTRFLSTYNWATKPESFYESFSLGAMWQIWRELRAGEIDLIVVSLGCYAPWNYRRLKAIFTRPFRPWKSLVRIFGVHALRFPRDYPPILAIDSEDSRTIERHNQFLFDKSKYFFKREVPMDRWEVFQHTAYAGLPGPRFRSNARNRMRVENLGV